MATSQPERLITDSLSRRGFLASTGAGVAAATLGSSIFESQPAQAASGSKVSNNGTVHTSDQRRLGPGVRLSQFSMKSSDHDVTGHLVVADLKNPHVKIGLLHPHAVGQVERVSKMTADQQAVAGVNGDYFNIAALEHEQHPDVEATGSSNGPEITNGHALKGAVPDSQRFGPEMAPNTSTKDVIGIGRDGKARLGELQLRGSIKVSGSHYQLHGLNQYALPENGIGAFTHAWGAVSRERAVCGDDNKRGAPCADKVAEVTVRRGLVVDVTDKIGSGGIETDDTVLVGRENGARWLRNLKVGQHITVRHRLLSRGGSFEFAMGGAPILHYGKVIKDVDDEVAATRTGAGINQEGRWVYLVALDGSAESGSGLTLRQLAELLAGFGAASGMNFDGGGSTTCAVRLPQHQDVEVVSSRPEGVDERAVANGLGIWTR